NRLLSFGILFSLPVILLLSTGNLAAELDFSLHSPTTKESISILINAEDNEDRPITGLEKKNFDIYFDNSYITNFGLNVNKQKIEKLSLIIAFDSSGSMKDNFKLSVQGCKKFINRLGNDVRIALYSFNDRSQREIDFTYDKHIIHENLDQLQMSGNYTLLIDTIYDSLMILKNRKAVKKGLIIFSDGIDENSALEISDIVNRNNALNIPIYIIGISDKAKINMLKRITKLSKGAFYRSITEENIDKLIVELSNQFANQYIATIPIDNVNLKEKHKIFVSIEHGGNKYVKGKKFQFIKEKDGNFLTSFFRNKLLSDKPFFWLYIVMTLLALILFILIILRIIKVKGGVGKSRLDDEEFDQFMTGGG
ncbi:MAG: VWA domain-containing protein, partial [Actinomycetia bacterium]|nr:VWA domain-containing protein [Actinomycetes bacterium]